MYAPINFTGGTYTHKSTDISSQTCRNFFPQLVDDPGAKEKYILVPWYGLSSFGSATGTNRGMFNHQETLYKLTAQTLYSVASDGTHTSLGTISGSGRAIFASMKSSLVVVANSVAYEWDGATLTTGTDGDFESPDTVAVINDQALYDGNTDRYAVSDVSTPLSINSLNYGTAESNGDNLLRVYAFEGKALMFGQRTLEKHWNSGVGTPPFDPEVGSTKQIGLGAVYSVAHSDNFVYWFGDDRKVYRMNAVNQHENILPDALQRTFANYTTVSDAFGWSMDVYGQEFYVLKFPTENACWCYPQGGQWFELSSGVTGDRWTGDGYAYIYGKHLVCDEEGGIFELTDSVYTENGTAVRRVRDSAPFHAGLLGRPGKRIEVSNIKLNFQRGVGLTSGQGSDPQIMFSWSVDGGKSFSDEKNINIGKMEENFIEINTGPLGSAETWVFRIAISDPVYCVIESAGMEFNVGI